MTELFVSINQIAGGMGISGCTDLAPSHPLCFPHLPKRDPYEPAQYQKDLMAKKWDSSAHGKEHMVLV